MSSCPACQSCAGILTWTPTSTQPCVLGLRCVPPVDAAGVCSSHSRAPLGGDSCEPWAAPWTTAALSSSVCVCSSSRWDSICTCSPRCPNLCQGLAGQVICVSEVGKRKQSGSPISSQQHLGPSSMGVLGHCLAVFEKAHTRQEHLQCVSTISLCHSERLLPAARAKSNAHAIRAHLMCRARPVGGGLTPSSAASYLIP